MKNEFLLIGPHEGRELELMLKGEKPIAMFYEVIGLEEHLNLIPENEFQPYVEKGQFIKKEVFFKSNSSNHKIRYVFYAQKDKSDSLNRLIQIKKYSHDPSRTQAWPDDLEYEVGQLLGYSNEAIEHFINHKRNYAKNS